MRFVIAEYVTTCHTNDDFSELTTFEASDTLDGSLPMQIYGADVSARTVFGKRIGAFVNWLSSTWRSQTVMRSKKWILSGFLPGAAILIALTAIGA